MGDHDELEKTFFARCGERLHVAFEHRLERLYGRPFRMLRSERLHPVQREGELGVHGVLDPQRAVIVEHRDALRFRDEVGRTLLGHLLDEGDDCLPSARCRSMRAGDRSAPSAEGGKEEVPDRIRSPSD